MKISRKLAKGGTTQLAHGFMHVGERVLEFPSPSPMHDAARILIVQCGSIEVRITESEAQQITRLFARK